MIFTHSTILFVFLAQTKCVIRCLVVIVCFSCFGQVAFPQSTVMKQYNREFTQINKSFVLRNPAFVDTSTKASFLAGYNGFNKLSENIKSFYFCGDVLLSGSQRNVKHHVGISVVNFQEGKFIKQYMAHVRYSQVFQIAEQTFVNTGFSAGFYSHTTEANSVTGHENRFTPDGSLGMKVVYRRFYAGLSASQLFQSRYVTYEKPTQLVRIYYINTGNRFFLDKEGKHGLDVAYILKSPDEFKTLTGYAYLNFSYRNLFEANVLFNDLSTLAVGIGLPKMKLGENDLGFSISYSTLFLDKQYSHVGNIELGLKYRIW
jgi:hypothetical protein